MAGLKKLHWRGSAVIKLAEEALADLIGDIGLAVEGEAKRELRKGHGVRSGTLRRSIHAAEPSYIFASDSFRVGEQGGKHIKAQRKNGKLVVSVGSGLVYAMAIHQGWSGHLKLKGAFSGYHYLTKAVDRVRPRVPSLVLRRKIK